MATGVVPVKTATRMRSSLREVSTGGCSLDSVGGCAARLAVVLMLSGGERMTACSKSTAEPEIALPCEPCA
jgi:hypothetical protein